VRKPGFLLLGQAYGKPNGFIVKRKRNQIHISATESRWDSQEGAGYALEGILFQNLYFAA